MKLVIQAGSDIGRKSVDHNLAAEQAPTPADRRHGSRLRYKTVIYWEFALEKPVVALGQ